MNLRKNSETKVNFMPKA